MTDAATDAGGGAGLPESGGDRRPRPSVAPAAPDGRGRRRSTGRFDGAETVTFHARVVPPSRRSDLPVREEVTDEYGFEPRVIVVCEVLERTDAAFVVSGFGQDPWPVDVGYDLSTFIESLHDALADLRSGRDAVIDMYGQGLERTIRVDVDGAVAVLRCSSRTDWIPDPAEETTTVAHVTALLERVYREFRVAVESTSREAAALIPRRI